MNKLLAVLLTALLLASCGGGQSSEDFPWGDDFSDPGSWQAETDASAEVGVEGGVLRVYVAVPNQLAWATAGKSDLGDFHLTVQATQVAGPDDNEYGVLVRLQDSGSFYRFSISGDGYFLVSKFDGGARELLGANWTPSDAINQGQATNVVEVICQGRQMTFTVNGQIVAQVEDAQYSSGDIGLYAGSFYESGVEIHFDDLIVMEP